MANQVDGFLPAVFDPLLDYLSTNLPGPLYAILVKSLSHAFGALSALIILCNSLLANAPESWNAQAILPPIITILAAYLALSSFYRTTSWMLRTSFWFMKWGTLFGIFIGGVGFLLGNGGGNAIGNQGGFHGIGGFFASLLEDPRAQPNSRSSRTRNRKSNAKRPKVWESFERHREWQYQEVLQEDDANEQVQQMLSTIVDGAGNLLKGNWWGMLNGVTGGDEGDEGPSPEAVPKRASTKTKRKGSTSGSR
ncbi:hypothetical protein BDN70DRAFT_872525 [Pholiota conissans]|uniref:Uncharacterized protein n=1 Tax=Pholiota conissans TaxID=109636 RepID=A0A9P6D616_9AGAR|nr:hypothetical protein BDN70DRAFT_872525 [Pholiota conissans]